MCMQRKRIEFTFLLVFLVLLPLCAEVYTSSFSFHWIITNQDNSSVFFTPYQDTTQKIISKEIQITTDPQEAFGVSYSTNKLGKHSIAFSSDPLSNGSLAIPYSLEFLYNGESFSTLVVGTEDQTYRSSVGTISIKRGSNSLFTANLYAMLTLGEASQSIEDFPAGDFTANLKFEVAVE